VEVPVIEVRTTSSALPSRITGGEPGAVEEPPNKRFDADPQQQRFASLLRAGQSQRSASWERMLTWLRKAQLRL
jgi:hypothetical protein